MQGLFVETYGADFFREGIWFFLYYIYLNICTENKKDACSIIATLGFSVWYLYNQKSIALKSPCIKRSCV